MSLTHRSGGAEDGHCGDPLGLQQTRVVLAVVSVTVAASARQEWLSSLLNRLSVPSGEQGDRGRSRVEGNPVAQRDGEEL